MAVHRAKFHGCSGRKWEEEIGGTNTSEPQRFVATYTPGTLRIPLLQVAFFLASFQQSAIILDGFFLLVFAF